MKTLYKHITIGLATLLLLSSCGNIFDKEPEMASDNTVVYLSVTRAQTAENFNADGVDFEDRVHDFAMLVFDSGTGQKVCTYYEENIPATKTTEKFTVKMKPGQRDFYFVANIPVANLLAIANKTNMETYIAAKTDMDNALYNGATTGKGFPMLRRYLNQTINVGGTETTPTPFNPGGEGKVKMERAVAKIEVTFPVMEAPRVASLRYYNSAKKFALLSQPETYTATDLVTKDFVSKAVGKWILYTPEISFATQPAAWNSTTPGLVNYIELTTTGGGVYKVPVVHNGPADNTYMNFAKKLLAGTPNFNVLRNNHYQFTLSNIPTDPTYDITVDYNVLPWTSKAIDIPSFE